MNRYLSKGSNHYCIQQDFESPESGDPVALDDLFSAKIFLQAFFSQTENMTALRNLVKEQMNEDPTLLDDHQVLDLVAGMISSRVFRIFEMPLKHWGEGVKPEKGKKDKPGTVPPKGKPEDKEEQKFKLVEVIEIVKRSGEGTVVGAAPASSSGIYPKLVDRTDKEGGAYKQFVNLGKDIEGSAKRHPEYDRFIELRARIEWVSGDKSKSLAGKKVHWSRTLDKQSGAKRPGNLNGKQNEGFGSANGSKTHVSSTDAKGWTTIVKFYLTQYSGDKFTISAQADVEENGKPSGAKLNAGKYEVWRKFWYQVTHAKGKAVTAPNASVNAYKLLSADMLKADEITFEKKDVANADRAFYPRWMVKGGNDTTEDVVIGGHNRTWFYGKYNKEKHKPVKGHLIICDHQWDPAGETGLFQFPVDDRTKTVKLNLGSWNAGILKPALSGKLVTHGKWKAKDNNKFTSFFRSIGIKLGVVDPMEGNLTDANVKIEKGRSALNEIKVELPANCPDPKKYPVTVELKVNYGKFYAGESNVHQMLIVYRSGEQKKFTQVVAHEFGHGFGQAPRPGKQPAGLPNHPKQYTNEHGGVGSHCSTAATLTAHAKYPTGLYKNGTCIMFHQVNPAGCTQKFCADCDPYLRLKNMNKLT